MSEKIYVSGSTLQTELDDASDSPSFEDRWREIIKFGTLYRAYNDLEDYAKSDRYFALYQNGINRMINNDDNKDNSIEFQAMDVI